MTGLEEAVARIVDRCSDVREAERVLSRLAERARREVRALDQAHRLQSEAEPFAAILAEIEAEAAQ